MKRFLSFSLGFFLFLPSVAAFTDVSREYVYYEAIEYVRGEGIVQGYSDGTYRPKSAINRAAFVKIIVEAKFKPEDIDTCLIRNPVGNNKYVFFPDTLANQWYTKYICLAKEKEIIKGDKDGNFRPDDEISFAEASKVIIMAFRYNTVESAPWYRQYVEALAERNAIPLDIQSFDKKITRGEMAEMIYRLLKGVTTKPSQTFFSLMENE